MLVFNEGTSKAKYSALESWVLFAPDSLRKDGPLVFQEAAIGDTKLIIDDACVEHHRDMPRMPCPAGGFGHETQGAGWNPSGPIRVDDVVIMYGMEYRHRKP